MALDEIEKITSSDAERCTLTDATRTIGVWSKTMNSTTEDDLSTEEIKDIKNHFSGTEQLARFSNVDDLIDDLDN